MKAKKMNANERIKRAMRDNERCILAEIRTFGIYPLFGCGLRDIPTWNALDRLEAKKKIRLTTRKGRKVYVAAKKGGAR